MKNLLIKSTFFLLTGWLMGCQPQTTENGKPYIVATTGMIADAAQNLAGPFAEVEGLMGPGVDPHLYKARPSDLEKMRKAEVILYNGLHLEGKMGEVFEKLANQKTVAALGEVVDEGKRIVVDEASNTYDPHVWFDVSLWKTVVAETAKLLKKQYPEQAATIEQNHVAYRKKLEELHQWVSAEMGKIPTEGRVLVTAHDAFGYFGKAYQTEVRGLQGISTISEPGLGDVQGLVDFIVERKIKAVFVETSVSEKLLEAVVSGCQQKGHAVKVGGTLYSDAMGAAGTPEGTYLGMVTSNVNTIVEGLR